MANLAPVLMILQTSFLAWTIFGCIAHVQGEATNILEDDATVTVLTSEESSGHQLSEQARRENIAIKPLPCPDACLFPLVCCLRDGNCLNTLTDPLNCGGCDRVCPPPNICCNGTCINSQTEPRNKCQVCDLKCPFPKTCCNGACVNLLTDFKNCGGCNIVCGEGFTCCNAVCVNLSTDPNNCGICGRRCELFHKCFSGSCF